MDLYPSSRSDRAWVTERLRLPNEMKPGIYNETGQPDPGGRLFLGMGSGIVHIWGVFKRGLAPGETGEMRFHNVPGSYVVTGNFSEWTPGPSGYSPHAIMRHEATAPPDLAKLTPPELEEGIWDLKVRVHAQPGRPPEEIIGTEEITLMPTASPHTWAIVKYRANFRGQPFEQHGILGYDANRERYVASFVKTVQANLGIFEGEYDPATRTLTLDGMTESCIGARDKNGKFIRVREKRIARYLDHTHRTLQVFQQEPGAGGDFGPQQPWVLKDEITAARRREIAAYPGRILANAPAVGDGIFSLIALERAQGEVKVVGRNNSPSHRTCAAGMVKLGPIWEQAFGDALRL